MSKPSFYNIDLWLFELAEGNLSAHQAEELRIFLLNHPELDVDKDVWEFAKVAPLNVVYPDQANLIRKRSKRAFVASSSIAVLLLIFVGCYSYLNQGITGSVIAKADTQTSEISSNSNSGGVNEQLTAYNRSGKIAGLFSEKEGIGFFNSLDQKYGFINSPLTYRPLDLLYSNLNTGSALYAFSGNISRGSLENKTDLHEKGIENGVNESWVDELAYSGTELTEEKELITKEVKTIITLSNKKNDRKKIKKSRRSLLQASGYKESIRSRYRRVALKMRRMFDNPIALKNYRDPHYHVPGKLANDVNFGATGTLLRTRVQAMSRMQWLGKENQQLMSQLSLDGYAYKMRGGLGVQLNHSLYNFGGLNVSDVAVTYSPKFSINNLISVEPSMRFKMGNKLLNAETMNGVEQVELSRGNAIDYYANGSTPTGNNLWYKDLGLGLMVNTKWFFAGIQVDNIYRHRDNIYSDDLSNPRRASNEIFATAGVDWMSKREHMKLSPYIVYHKNENLSEAWCGANYQYNWFTIGAAVSTQMEPAASLGMKFDRFAVVYNADYTKSDMTGKQALSHQLTLRYTAEPGRYGRKLLNIR